MQNTKRYNPSTKKPILLKGFLLYFLIFPLIITLFFALLKAKAITILYTAISLFIFLSANFIAKKGFLAQKEYEKSTIAKAPKYPYKLIASIMLSFGVLFSSYFLNANQLLFSIILAISTFVGFYLYYGFDVRVDKVQNSSSEVGVDEVIDITNEAKSKVEDIENLLKSIKQKEIQDRLNIIIKETKDMIDIVQNDPSTLKRARKFFNIYLNRTQKITTEYVKNLNYNNIDHKIEQNYINLLNTLEISLKKQKERLNQKDLTMLDVQIEVLTKQLKQEGAKHAR